MKKLLVVLLALVMVIAMATSAMAFTDTDDLSTVQQDSVYRLYALGILNGYPDGTFGADNQITRAEFAKIACIVAGFGNVSDLMSNTPSSFTDVAVGMWYTGYVNVAASQGYVHGYPDGTFKPNAPITMAEVVTVLMRIAGYNDNLPGPWPFDYIAQAGKEDVTDDVTFVSSVAATRADVAVMVNHLLDVNMVNYDNDISDFVDDEDEGTVMEGAFGAATYDIIFNNLLEQDDALDGWFYSDYDEREVTFSFFYADEDYDFLVGNTIKDNGSYLGSGQVMRDEPSDENLIMNEDCYFADGYSLTSIGGMEAEIITNDDEEVIYVNVVSSVSVSDDVEGYVWDEREEDLQKLEIDGDQVDTDPSVAPWFNEYFDYTRSGYAKIFYNEDGDVYAVFDIYYSVGTPLIVDNYDEDDEALYALAGDDVDLEDADYTVLKGGHEIDITDLNQMDVVYVLEPLDGQADLVLMVSGYFEGTLTEGEDSATGGSITVGGRDFNFTIDYDEEEDEPFLSRYNTEGGVDGDFNILSGINDLDDVFDADVQIVTYRNPYEVAYLVTDVDASSSTVYGIVTDLTISGLFDNVADVTILNQDGEEVTYDLDDDDIFTFNDAGATADTDVELGSYVAADLDKDGVITSADIYLAADFVGEYDTMTVSGSKIKIEGTWYKVTDDTLFFETVTNGYEDYDSADFDEANLIAVDDILSADEVSADGIKVFNDGGSLERIYLIDSDISVGNEGYSFVDRLYTNSTGDFVEMMDGTVAERKDGESYSKNVFYAYDMVNGEMITTELFDCQDPGTDEGLAYEDAYWVLGVDDLQGEGEEDDLLAGELADKDTTYNLEDFQVYVVDYSGDTLKLGDGFFYTVTDDTQFYTVDGSGVVDTGDDGDIDEGGYIGAISDEDGNLLYVFVLPVMSR